MERIEALFFGLATLLLQALTGLHGRWGIGVVAALIFLAYLVAHLLQWRLKRSIQTRPDQTATLGRTEALFSIVAPAALLYFSLEWIVKRIRRWLLRRQQNNRPVLKEGGKALKSEKASGAVLVATLGPTFLLAGLLSGAAYCLAWLTEPLFSRSFAVSSGHSFWQYLFLGQRPEFAWLLPLEAHPLAAVVLCLVFWMVVWWTLGNVLRGLVFRSELQLNLFSRRETALTSWESSFGVEGLMKPGRAYRRWATWLVTAAIVLIAASWTTLERQDGGIAPSTLALGLVIILSWVLHLHLRGFSTPSEPTASAQKPVSETERPGWPQVADELQRRYGFQAPEPLFERPMQPLRLSVGSQNVPTLSPFAAELLANPNEEPEAKTPLAMTVMQSKVLESLSLLGFVHLDPPVSDSVLTLQQCGLEQIEDRSGLSERNQIVLAPEGSGKTTLAMLAAANHALVHARATLLITRSTAQAEEVYEQIRSAVEPSTVRWNLRLRQVGRDFAADLSRDIIPDIVVASLHQLVTSLLDNTEVYTPFLRNVGLVVVDDVESFAGAVEIHAQLAFRRLHLLFAQLAEVERLGEANAPLMLVLGVDSMKETAVWAKSLCGIRAVVRTFSAGATTDGGNTEGQQIPRAKQLGFHLGDFHTDDGRALTVAEVADACESRGVPWHYRPCGDDRRRLGRGPLLMQQEPELARSPGEACVHLLEGRWSEVRRELRRLAWAGLESGRSEIVFLTMIEPEERAACGALDPAFGLAREQAQEDLSDLATELTTLPLPVVRPPSSIVVQSHLLSDLLQRWIEVKELVTTFEAPVARALRHLKSQGMLHTEERSDVRPELKAYESKVYVRALATAISTEGGRTQEEGIVELGLFDKVRQVELISRTAVAVRNRADHTQLCQVEADSAGLIYYPGRVFENASGRFVVVGRTQKGNRFGAIEVEPVLHHDVSSPRRRFEIVEIENRTNGESSTTIPYALLEPELVLLGRDPLEIGLVAVRVTIQALATYRLARITGEIRSREIHSRAVQELFQPAPLETAALVMRPNPERSPSGAPPLRFGEARLLATLLRFLLPLLYRDTRENVEVALATSIHADPGAEPGSSPAWDRPLGSKDGFYVLDLHQGGNGTARALYREGLQLPLRLCRHFLDQVSDLQRLLRLYDHWGDLDEILAEDRLEEKSTEGESASRLGAVARSALEAEEESVDTADDERRAESLESTPEDTNGLVEAAREERTPGSGNAGADEPEVATEVPAGNTRHEAAWPWAEIQLGLRQWLDSRIHPEPVQETSEIDTVEEDPVEASRDEEEAA